MVDVSENAKAFETEENKSDKWLWSGDKKTLLAYYGDNDSPTIPSCCTRIGSYAFSDSSVEYLVIPDSVHDISPFAFQNCSSLRMVFLPAGLKRIEEGTFMGCNSLTFVPLPSSIQYIGKNAFSGCLSLYQIELPKGLLMIDDGAFGGSGLFEVTVCDTPLIGTNAFAYCKYLRSVKLGGVKRIGENAFKSCESLQAVHMDDHVFSIGACAFFGCLNLTSVNIPSGVLEIGDSAFAKIPEISVNIPQTLEGYVTHFSRRDEDFLNESAYIFERSAKLHYYGGEENE